MSQAVRYGYGMPAAGGLKTAIPIELLEKAKELYLQGLTWPSIAEQTGLKASSLSVIASIKGWTAIKAEQRAKEELSGLRGGLHGTLKQLHSKVKVPDSHSPRKLQPVADLVLTLTNAAEKVEGWAPTAGNTLVNVSVLSECTISAPVSTDPVLELPVQSEQSMLISGQTEQEQEG